ncbi:hypothetical protein SS1G_05619 [Sclerotinia sclerotiorum 1980 UF-70]|uniref:Uncharacterized protein n=1 Tax=Sclerotinia sclerotiorum (strain ATCC 18683 / 1980 / Ss-1) TaxID=665079 RepID=A7EJX4_SCLS1|nr:hypothetical protein SS1G_05619 [Sclerotinia sclerotiorum 1980 UF-70]EDO03140.1 hypothetical protein SS1G_05619 [Sclerotinia sclerotiorum 1980 UF-70]
MEASCLPAILSRGPMACVLVKPHGPFFIRIVSCTSGIVPVLVLLPVSLQGCFQALLLLIPHLYRRSPSFTVNGGPYTGRPKSIELFAFNSPSHQSSLELCAFN